MSFFSEAMAIALENDSSSHKKKEKKKSHLQIMSLISEATKHISEPQETWLCQVVTLTTYTQGKVTKLPNRLMSQHW